VTERVQQDSYGDKAHVAKVRMTYVLISTAPTEVKPAECNGGKHCGDIAVASSWRSRRFTAHMPVD